jgi:hypothetical protein
MISPPRAKQMFPLLLLGDVCKAHVSAPSRPEQAKLRQHLGLAAGQGAGKSVLQSIKQGMSGSILPSHFPWQRDVLHAQYQQARKTGSRSQSGSVISVMTHLASRQKQTDLEGKSYWQEVQETQISHRLAPNAECVKGEKQRGRFIR